MSVTLKQIADEVGVSQPLVTYAMNGKAKVKEETRRKILETAARLGYEDFGNREARSLAAKRHGRRMLNRVITLVYSVTDNQPWLNDAFNSEVVGGVERAAWESKFGLYLTAIQEAEVPRIVRSGGTDGVIFQHTPKNLDKFLEFDIPLVLLCSHSKRMHSLVADDEQGIYLATRHLLELGHKRIAFLGAYEGTLIGNARSLGYRRALSENGLPITHDLQIYFEQTTAEEGTLGMRQLLARRRQSPRETGFTAVVCFNDNMAMGAIRAAQEAGLRVPEDLSVTGFDDISTQHNFQPGITSVNFPRFEIGRRAVTLIAQESISRAETVVDESRDNRTPAITERFPVTLQVRETTRPPASS